MAQETEDQVVETEEPAAEVPETAETPHEDSQEEVQTEPQTEEEAPEEEPEKKKKRKGGLLLKFLCVLLVILIFLEAGAVYFWFVLDRVSSSRAPEEEAPVQRTVTSSAYANWNGSFRPSDWPEAVGVQAESPPILEAEGEGTEP